MADPNVKPQAVPKPAASDAAKAPGPKPTDGMEEVTTSKNDRKFTYSLGIGIDLASMVALHGDQAVYSHARSHMIISLQGMLRRMMESTDPVYSDADLLKAANDWKAGVKIVRAKSDADKIGDLLDKMTPEERKAFFADYAT